jgi:hypothetical protein
VLLQVIEASGKQMIKLKIGVFTCACIRVRVDMLCSPGVVTFTSRIPDKTPFRHDGIEDLNLTLGANICVIVEFDGKTGVLLPL